MTEFIEKIKNFLSTKSGQITLGIAIFVAGVLSANLFRDKE